MPPWERQTCRKRTLRACAITSLVLLVGLLMFVVIYLTLSWQDIVGEHSIQDLTFDPSGDMYDDCRSKAAVVSDEPIMQRWDTSTNFSKAWGDAEQKAREPVHNYMEKHHSIAIYMYTNFMLQPVRPDLDTAERTGKQLRQTSEFPSLYSSLSEAIQILKHSQVTCLSTHFRTETHLNLNISNKPIRFSSFMLGSKEWNLTRNASCFEVYTCFGADVTHYSALKLHSQVLIPPYEVFKVTEVETDAQRCEVVYRLRSNLNCVYDKESNMLHPISALPMNGFWIIFIITCMMIVSLMLPFVIMKVLEKHKKTAVYTASSLHSTMYSPARVCI